MSIRYVVYFLLIGGFCLAQESHQLTMQESGMKILGTSTLHDWESIVEQGTGEINVNIENGKLVKINSLRLSFNVKGIKSGKSAMDSKTYEALKEEKHPSIVLKLREVKSISNASGIIKIQMSSDLSIAGVTKQITTVSNVTYSKSGGISSKGQLTLKMSSFQVDPPTAVMGTIKCGDEITIEYSLTFKSV